jgi:hypothetical protein
VHVSGIGDRHAQGVAFECVRDGNDPLHHVDGQLLGRLLRDPGHGQVDEGEVEPARERSGDALGRGGTFVEQRLGERASLLDPPANARELVGGDQAGCLEQVGDELRDLVDREGRIQAWAPVRAGRLGFRATGEPQLVWPLEIHRIPRTRYRQIGCES